MTVDEFDTKQMWKSISSALGTEMREATSIRGVSGQDHPVQAIAVDDKTKRVVIFSAEPSPRIAALMQVDVQGTMSDVHVLVARPVIWDLAEIGRRIVENIHNFDIQEIAGLINAASEPASKEILESKISPVIKPLIETATIVQLPASVQIVDVLQQLMSLDWNSSFVSSRPLESFLTILFLTTTLDSSAADRQLGICPIPLYDFSAADYELLLSGDPIHHIQARLKRLGIYQ